MNLHEGLRPFGVENCLIFPSIASSDHSDFRGEVQKLADYPLLHIDIEDGNFVPNITFGLKTVRAVRKLSAAAFDAHLMVTNPAEYIPALLEMDFKAIAFHWESTQYPMALINSIRKGNAKAGIAINPRTPASELFPYLSRIDYVLVMASEPDGCGDEFQYPTLEKIRQLRAADPTLPILVDGGISARLLPMVLEAGASHIVMGRAVFSSEDPYKTMQEFNRNVEQ